MYCSSGIGMTLPQRRGRGAEENTHYNFFKK
jgi:hypothetical protein